MQPINLADLDDPSAAPAPTVQSGRQEASDKPRAEPERGESDKGRRRKRQQQPQQQVPESAPEGIEADAHRAEAKAVEMQELPRGRAASEAAVAPRTDTGVRSLNTGSRAKDGQARQPEGDESPRASPDGPLELARSLSQRSNNKHQRQQLQMSSIGMLSSLSISSRRSHRRRHHSSRRYHPSCSDSGMRSSLEASLSRRQFDREKWVALLQGEKAGAKGSGKQQRTRWSGERSGPAGGSSWRSELSVSGISVSTKMGTQGQEDDEEHNSRSLRREAQGGDGGGDESEDDDRGEEEGYEAEEKEYLDSSRKWRAVERVIRDQR